MPTDYVLPSTLFLTFLLLIGLVFFLRASTKNRTEVKRLPAPGEPTPLLTQIQNHLTGRAYRIIAVSPEQEQITFEGLVSASLGLAIFLTILAVLGLGSLGLVLGMIWPPLEGWGLGLVILAPLATIFYWQGAQRHETVTVQVERDQTQPGLATITITAHRDELIALNAALNPGD
ncbi:cofactor assembly of complex C subunit B [Thermosynechococcaceae cyanobacterium BACA0444]|uniref:Cofactor assembly of complex C subunit B n=1 Tax=Pseudocalidococcus azoricus BACA0444 TaxID=2918990 RepID=A0AAE4JYK0_9CYAN|nr:cofactor assembly of complex C subunit B [Pseudocalidococcus azoricus]MDS3861074.1 cofactor assembly of complex C subunit B [Pseudocalidococcus azoricus BACA0444]